MKLIHKIAAPAFAVGVLYAFTGCLSLPVPNLAESLVDTTPATTDAEPKYPKGFTGRNAALEEVAHDPWYWDLQLASEPGAAVKVYTINEKAYYAIFPVDEKAKYPDNAVSADLEKALVLKAEEIPELLKNLEKLSSGYKAKNPVYYDYNFYRMVPYATVTDDGKTETLKRKEWVLQAQVQTDTEEEKTKEGKNVTVEKIIKLSVKGTVGDITINDLDAFIAALKK